MFMEFISKSIGETQKIAKNLAQKIIRTKRGGVIALEGELGAGKTTFIQGFAKALGIKEKIKSPTFVLMKKYTIAKSFKLKAISLYHFDCYRIRDYKDLKILNLKEIFESSRNIILIEWAERIKKIIPKKHVKIHIDHIDKNTRKLTIDYRP